MKERLSMSATANFDHIKHYYCLLPSNDTSRPFIVPSIDYSIHFDDFLLLCNVPSIIAKPLAVIKHLVSTPLNDKNHFIQLCQSKLKNLFLKELLFISAKVIASMVETEAARSETQNTILKNTLLNSHS